MVDNPYRHRRSSVMELNEAAHPYLLAILRRLLPDGHLEGAEYVAHNPRRDDRSIGSFKFNTLNQVWADFATEDRGRGIVSFVAFLHALTRCEAVARVRRMLSHGEDAMSEDDIFRPLTAEERVGTEPAAGRSGSDRGRQRVPIVPVPDDAPALDYRHPIHGTPSAVWAYCDHDGALLGYVARWDIVGEDGTARKVVRPLTHRAREGAPPSWGVGGMPGRLPLYRLPELLARSAAPVIVCEGEPTADAAGQLFPDYVCTTSAQGARSADRTDWAPLAGRRVWLAADNDDPGRAYVAAVAQKLEELGCEVGVLDWPAHLTVRDGEIVAREGDVPAGFDLADAVAEGWTAEHINTLMSDHALFVHPHPWSQAAAPDDDRGDVFGLDPEVGLFRIDPANGRRSWICSPIEVLAYARDPGDDHWGLHVRVRNPDGAWLEWIMPRSMLAGNGLELRQRLFELGLQLAPGADARFALQEYFNMARPSERLRCVTRVGWCNDVFVLPDRSFGETSETIRLQSPSAVLHAYNIAGTLDDWQVEIGRYCIGNARLIFAVGCAFAAPLLRPLEAEPGGFHLRGASSTGKTSALCVAGSVCGGGAGAGFCRSWRATANGLEGVAALHNDLLLCLDEMGEASGHDVGEAVYLLMNGTGKARANRTGALRRIADWRTLVLSTGEVTFADRLREVGRSARAGQEVRLVDLPADAGAGLGLFEHLHSFAAPAALADHLRQAAGGFTGRRFGPFSNSSPPPLRTSSRS
jgi:putative DNA primase/helicase